MLLPSVSANETGLITLSDLNFTESNITEIEKADNVDFDGPTLIANTIIQSLYEINTKVNYFTPFIVKSYFKSFHSRAPPVFISHYTIST